LIRDEGNQLRDEILNPVQLGLFVGHHSSPPDKLGTLILPQSSILGDYNCIVLDTRHFKKLAV
jgi:hypothetical protein